MSSGKIIRLGQASIKLNIGRNTILEFLAQKGFQVESNPNAKLTDEQFKMLSQEFAASASEKREALSLVIKNKGGENVPISAKLDAAPARLEEEEQVMITNVGSAEPIVPLKETLPAPEKIVREKPVIGGVKMVGMIDLDQKKKASPREEEKPIVVAPPPKLAPPEKKYETIKAKAVTLGGLKVVDKIVIPETPKSSRKAPVASSDKTAAAADLRKKSRKRIYRAPESASSSRKEPARHADKPPANEQEIQKQIRATLAKLSGSGKRTSSRRHKEKRRSFVELREVDADAPLKEQQTLRVAEFISAKDLASLISVSVNEIISTGLDMGMFISINQRLDAEAITVISDEFGYNVEFASDAADELIEEEEDNEADLKPRAPIITVMGHVDHGKTSLLDYIRNSKVAAQEAGGITQHIKAYDVTTRDGRKITFLDTPGHEAFMAMRARGAKLTDIAIIVVAADDDVMPQTKEAINHAKVAGIPMVIAINKIDKPAANVEKVKESLSAINILVEDWGGKYQSQPISAKTGQGIDELLDKVLLEAEMLDLKANPERPGVGSVVEASLDKGRGYTATIIVQTGKLKVGDIVLAGSHFGRVKALINDLGKSVKTAGPSTPVQILGLNGAPQAGEKFHVVKTDREARELAVRRDQLMREQSVRTKKHITLDEIGRRLALGSFKELKVILKGDVDGSVEALSDSLLKLSTPTIQVDIIHKAVGPISESDVLLASASDAVVIGFQVRPSAAARKLADSEKIEIRLYSIIYDAINDVKAAIEGMFEKETEEVIVGNAEVREVFKISKVGTVAGSMVTTGYMKAANPIRLVREGIVIYSGELAALKRFKDSAAEVKSGFECGLSITGFNDIKVGDVVESYEVREVK